MQVGEGFEDLAAVGDDVLDVEDEVALPGRLDDGGQGPVADVLHHDVAAGDRAVGAAGADEVPDLDDAFVPDGDEAAALLGGLDGAAFRVPVQHSLHGDEVFEVGVAGEVDPALAAVGDGPEDAVLVLEQRPVPVEFGSVGVRGAASGAVALLGRRGGGERGDEVGGAGLGRAAHPDVCPGDGGAQPLVGGARVELRQFQQSSGAAQVGEAGSGGSPGPSSERPQVSQWPVGRTAPSQGAPVNRRCGQGILIGGRSGPARRAVRVRPPGRAVPVPPGVHAAGRAGR